MYAPYVITAIAHAFIAVIVFFPFNFNFRTNPSIRLYFFIIFSFILFYLILSNSSMPKYVYHSFSNSSGADLGYIMSVALTDIFS